jgi:hypothetical protein
MEEGSVDNANRLPGTAAKAHKWKEAASFVGAKEQNNAFVVLLPLPLLLSAPKNES